MRDRNLTNYRVTPDDDGPATSCRVTRIVNISDYYNLSPFLDLLLGGGLDLGPLMSQSKSGLMK